MLTKALVERLAVVATAGRKVIGGRSAPTHVVAPFHPRNGPMDPRLIIDVAVPPQVKGHPQWSRDGPHVNVVTVTPVRVSVRSQNPFSFWRDNLPPKRGPFASSTEVEPTAFKRAAPYPNGRDSAGEDYILPPTGGEPAAPFFGVT